MKTESTIQDVFVLSGVLTDAELQHIQVLLQQADFSDGRATASDAARNVKQNLQIEVQNQTVLPVLQQLIGQALMRYPVFHSAFFPTRLYPFLISKYEPGMQYGWHVDSPIMGNPPVRTDLAMTLFLSEPDSYEGGALVIRGAQGETAYKPQKGDAVVYPCRYVHCVSEVTKGTRLAAVSWIQSAVRSPEQRAILISLKQVYDQLCLRDPHSAEANQLLQTWSNLLRIWAEI